MGRASDAGAEHNDLASLSRHIVCRAVGLDTFCVMHGTNYTTHEAISSATSVNSDNVTQTAGCLRSLCLSDADTVCGVSCCTVVYDRDG